MDSPVQCLAAFKVAFLSEDFTNFRQSESLVDSARESYRMDAR